jgi:hypothetical protein
VVAGDALQVPAAAAAANVAKGGILNVSFFFNC